MKTKSVRCDICKIDILKVSYSRHWKSKKRLENIQQNKVNTLRTNPIEPNEKSKNSKSETKDENLWYFTDRLLKIAYDIDIDNHHEKHAISIKTITSKFNKRGVDIIHSNRILIEMANIYATWTNQYRIKYQLTFFGIIEFLSRG